MHYYEVAPNKIVRAGSAFFTYEYSTKLSVGALVVIPVGKKEMIGVILRSALKPTYATKSIISVIETTPLPHQLVLLASWLSTYYLSPLAIVLQTMLPHGLLKNRRPMKPLAALHQRDRTNIVFNTEQQKVLANIEKNGAGTYLLEGVTGSGKTEIYIDLVKQSIAQGKSAIVLVPEIALTSQLVAEFAHHFEDIIITHSTMTESQRHQIWQDALAATSPRIVIGPRSALFTPLRDIGVIIVDECHEPSYKQEQSPRYSALRAATMLGRFHDAKVIFGSATPSITDRYLAEKSDRPILRLTHPARLNTIAPVVTLVDMTKRNNFNGHHFISEQLTTQLTDTLTSGKQALIFHNRRGSASTTLCKNCGWTAQCPRCFIPLTLHIDHHQLRCHICDHQERVPTSCPSCGNANIVHKGIGTKLIESELRRLFPAASIARFDTDNSNIETVNARYSELYDGTIDIAIGTQVVAKGLDLPHLRLVGIIQADNGLALPDFSSRERTFQLIAQVVGRVGRNEHASQVIVQTYQPTHTSIVDGLNQNYESFYKEELKERQRGIFPPFTHLLKLTNSYKTETAAVRSGKNLAQILKKNFGKTITILGPTPSFYERQNNTYRWQIVLKSPKREQLIQALNLIPSTHWQSELDPTSLL